ncbi:hypothetical protein [Mycobacterium attenuatum]|uniref:hypothetical protein n=1 Tax=Mycobacterium attenuatum TaxID=2341086 RepID=UPI000F02C635|nr:hypothetical protein [Mycobacterium attenuatum]
MTPGGLSDAGWSSETRGRAGCAALSVRRGRVQTNALAYPGRGDWRLTGPAAALRGPAAAAVVS